MRKPQSKIITIFEGLKLSTDVEPAEPPRMFISYRWTSPEHEQWVLELATSLRSDGVDVILDKWHLKEGHDTFAFMERMVSDPTVSKVLLICDEGYVDRADKRQGGVGTEAQIVSPEVYTKADQTKFAAAVCKLDADGRPLLPKYLVSRLYFDFSTQDSYPTSYEKVLRWCYNKPFHVAPAVGKPPKFLDATFESNSSLLGSSAALRSVRLRGGDARDVAGNVLDGVIEDAKKLSLSLIDLPDPDQIVVDTIEQAIPLREQAISAIDELVKLKRIESVDTIHQFLEDLSSLWEYGRPENGRYSMIDNDSLHFFIHSTFVGFIARCLRHRSFDLADSVISLPFFRPNQQSSVGKGYNYTSFRPFLRSLDELRKSRLKLNRISVHADILKDSFNHSIVSFGDFMEADFSLYLRGLVRSEGSEFREQWFPISLVYAGHSYGAFPTYVRATSKAFFDRLSPLLAGASADDVRAAIQSYRSNGRGLRFGGWDDPDIAELANAEALSTIP